MHQNEMNPKPCIWIYIFRQKRLRRIRVELNIQEWDLQEAHCWATQTTIVVSDPTGNFPVKYLKTVRNYSIVFSMFVIFGLSLKIFFHRFQFMNKFMHRVTHKGQRLQRWLFKICSSIFLHSGLFVGQNRLTSVLSHLANHQNSQLNTEQKQKNQASNRHIIRVLGRL